MIPALIFFVMASYNQKAKVRSMKKQHLPQKICQHCQRPYTWRKKWEKVWLEVRFCSTACSTAARRNRKQSPQ
ncbi:DUF2256 domain-containing protein [Cellvibrio sp.]|uniref:DUF2256 domain-containing protein n=1 Tax=Cellvibrio sp. TaxID=1965322 RepID=UPI00374EE4B2